MPLYSERIAFAGNRHSKLHLETGRETLLTDHFADERYPAWSPMVESDEPDSP